jgi:hypothetical protein
MPQKIFPLAFVVLLLSLGVSECFADEAGTTPLYFNGNGSVSYGSFGAQVGSYPPKELQYALGGIVAYRLMGSWLIGLSSDFNFVRQISDVGASGGNYKGTRWNIVSPTIGWLGSKFTALGDLQFLGNYNFSAANAAFGGSDSLTGPLGFRVRGTYDFAPTCAAGLQFSYTSFSDDSNSISGSINKAQSFSFWSVGIMASHEFY